MSVSDTTWGVPGSKQHTPAEVDEHAVISGVHGKKVFVVGADGNQVSFPSLVTSAYDYIALTYVAAGNGAGEVETVTFKNGGAEGTTVSTLTLAYNASNEISSVTKT